MNTAPLDFSQISQMSAMACMSYLTSLQDEKVVRAVEAQFSESRDRIIEALRWGVWYASESRDNGARHIGECAKCGRVTMDGRCVMLHDNLTTLAMDMERGD